LVGRNRLITLIVWLCLSHLVAGLGCYRSSLIWSSLTVVVIVVVVVAVVAGVSASVEATESVVDAVRVRLTDAPTVGLFSGARFHRG